MPDNNLTAEQWDSLEAVAPGTNERPEITPEMKRELDALKNALKREDMTDKQKLIDAARELLPCPKCHGTYVELQTSPVYKPEVVCTECGISLQGEDVDDAIQEWNTRATEQQIALAVAEERRDWLYEIDLRIANNPEWGDAVSAIEDYLATMRGKFLDAKEIQANDRTDGD